MSCIVLHCSVADPNSIDPGSGSRLFGEIGCARDNLRGQKSLGPLKMSLETAQKVIVPQKKIMSRSFLNSGTLIVKNLPPYKKNLN
jgi:hypothetical protein